MHPLGIMTVYTKLHDNPTNSCSVISTTKQKDIAVPRAVQLVWQEPSFILLQLLNLQMCIYELNTVIKVSCFLINNRRNLVFYGFWEKCPRWISATIKKRTGAKVPERS